MAKKTVNDDRLEALYQGVMTCEPVIPVDLQDEVADLVFSKERMIRAWRLAAFLGTKDGSFFKELSTDATMAQTFAPVLGALEDTAELLREMASIMDCVGTRVAVAGCNHQKFEEWKNEDVEVQHV